MKFYFCEKCGKRLTEEQIGLGTALDKKLNGVFCADCAAGVKTLETLPLTDAEAKQILKNLPPSGVHARVHRASGAHRPPSSSNNAVHNASRTLDAKLPRPPLTPPSPEQTPGDPASRFGSTALVVGVVVSLIGMALVWMLFFF